MAKRPLSDILHDQVDSEEELSAAGRDVVRERMGKLRDALAAVAEAEGAMGEPTPGEPWAGMMLAVEEIIKQIAEGLDTITTKAAVRSIRLGAERVGGRGEG